MKVKPGSTRPWMGALAAAVAALGFSVLPASAITRPSHTDAVRVTMAEYRAPAVQIQGDVPTVGAGYGAIRLTRSYRDDNYGTRDDWDLYRRHQEYLDNRERDRERERERQRERDEERWERERRDRERELERERERERERRHDRYDRYDRDDYRR